MQRSEHITHPLLPIYTADSRILILGTMPSPASRAVGCYYGHPQNRFWKVMGNLFSASPPPADAEGRRVWLEAHRIAVWDVLASCTICGASDSSITEPVPNDLSLILDTAPIQAIFTTGSKAHTLYNKYCRPITHCEAIALPSTSPANCRTHNIDTLTEAYRILLRYIET